MRKEDEFGIPRKHISEGMYATSTNFPLRLSHTPTNYSIKSSSTHLTPCPNLLPFPSRSLSPPPPNINRLHPPRHSRRLRNRLPLPPRDIRRRLRLRPRDTLPGKLQPNTVLRRWHCFSLCYSASSGGGSRFRRALLLFAPDDGVGWGVEAHAVGLRGRGVGGDFYGAVVVFVVRGEVR